VLASHDVAFARARRAAAVRSGLPVAVPVQGFVPGRQARIVHGQRADRLAEYGELLRVDRRFAGARAHRSAPHADEIAEVEQAAFCPGNVVPGIAVSPDKMLQARVFSYHDTHIHRLGPNYHLIPVNSPKGAPEHSYQRDGFMRVDGGGGPGPNYWPNSFGGPAPDPGAGEPPFEVTGPAGRHPDTFPNDDFVQPGDLYRKVMTEMDREHLIGNIVDHLGNAAKRIQMRQTALFFKADADYGRRVAAGLGWISLRWNAWRPCLRKNGRKPPRREPSAERGYKGSLPGLLREGQPGA